MTSDEPIETSDELQVFSRLSSLAYLIIISKISQKLKRLRIAIFRIDFYNEAGIIDNDPFR